MFSMMISSRRHVHSVRIKSLSALAKHLIHTLLDKPSEREVNANFWHLLISTKNTLHVCFILWMDIHSSGDINGERMPKINLFLICLAYPAMCNKCFIMTKFSTSTMYITTCYMYS